MPVVTSDRGGTRMKKRPLGIRERGVVTARGSHEARREAQRHEREMTRGNHEGEEKARYAPLGRMRWRAGRFRCSKP